MTLGGFIDRIGTERVRLAVINSTKPDPLYSLLQKRLGNDTVEFEERADGDASDTVVLETEEGEQLARSPLQDIVETLLLVNSDLYITGTRSLDEVDTPAVIEQLAGTRFRLAGRQKFLLIHMSRHIEAMATERGVGVLHSGFQDLSRIEDEAGTHRVYRQLSETAVETCAYAATGTLERDLGLHTCVRDIEELRSGWFVVYRQPDSDAAAALVAVETGDNAWDGVWTFDPAWVGQIERYLRDRYDTGLPSNCPDGLGQASD